MDLALIVFIAASILNKIGRDELHKVKKVEIVEPIHFVGIGGSGMRPLAELCVNLEFHFLAAILRAQLYRFLKEKSNIFIGHKKENITDCKTLVVSSAIDKPIRNC